MKVVVYRTDMESEFNKTASSQAGLSEEQVETLDRIDANVQQLLAVGISTD